MKKTTSRSVTRILYAVAMLAVAGVSATTLAWFADAEKVEFSRSTVDFGIVCSDVSKSVAFYRDVVGLTEIQGFDVPAQLGADAGLVDHKDLSIRVMVAEDSPSATRVKLMEIKDAPGRKIDNDFIHTSLGMSYTTFWVKDINVSLKRCETHDVKLLAKSPVALPNGIFLAVVRDPDGNFVELVGPKKPQ